MKIHISTSAAKHIKKMPKDLDIGAPELPPISSLKLLSNKELKSIATGYNKILNKIVKFDKVLNNTAVNEHTLMLAKAEIKEATLREKVATLSTPLLSVLKEELTVSDKKGAKNRYSVKIETGGEFSKVVSSITRGKKYAKFTYGAGTFPAHHDETGVTQRIQAQYIYGSDGYLGIVSKSTGPFKAYFKREKAKAPKVSVSDAKAQYAKYTSHNKEILKKVREYDRLYDKYESSIDKVLKHIK